MGQLLPLQVGVPHVEAAGEVFIAVRRVEGHGADGPVAVLGESPVDVVEGGLVQAGRAAGGHIARNGVLGPVLVHDNPQGALGIIVPVVVGVEGNLQGIAVPGAAGGPENQVVDDVVVAVAAGVIELLPGQLVPGEVGVAGDADFAGKTGVVRAGVKLHVVHGPAGVGRVLIGVVEIPPVEGDRAAGGHPVHHVSLLSVLVNDDAEGAVVIVAAVVVEPEGHGQLVALIGLFVGLEVDGVQGVIPAVAVVHGVEGPLAQPVPVHGAGAGVEGAVKAVVAAGGEEGHIAQAGGISGELLIGVLKMGDLEIHRAAGGHPVHDVGGGRRRAGDGEGAGDLVAVAVLGGVAQGEAAGGAGDEIEVAAQLVIGEAAGAQGGFAAGGVELSASAHAGEADGGEGGLSGQAGEFGRHLGADVAADELAAGGPGAEAGVLAGGPELVDGGIAEIAVDGVAGGAGDQALVFIGVIAGRALVPALEDMAAADGGEGGAGDALRLAALGDALRKGAGAGVIGDGIGGGAAHAIAAGIAAAVAVGVPVGGAVQALGAVNALIPMVAGVRGPVAGGGVGVGRLIAAGAHAVDAGVVAQPVGGFDGVGLFAFYADVGDVAVCGAGGGMGDAVVLGGVIFHAALLAACCAYLPVCGGVLAPGASKVMLAGGGYVLLCPAIVAVLAEILCNTFINASRRGNFLALALFMASFIHSAAHSARHIMFGIAYSFDFPIVVVTGRLCLSGHRGEAQDHHHRQRQCRQISLPEMVHKHTSIPAVRCGARYR